jgi:hypothetical protein
LRFINHSDLIQNHRAKTAAAEILGGDFSSFAFQDLEQEKNFVIHPRPSV